MIDVTVVLLDDGFTSTAVVPVEIFHAAGTLWNALHGQPAEPAFRVRPASITGAAVRSPYGLAVQPTAAIGEIERTDIVMVTSSGLELDASLLQNTPLLPWLRRQHAGGAYVAGVCMGAAYLAEAGLLDDRVATTHWALAADLAERYPRVCWRPEFFITEDSRLLCSGGVYAAVDLSLYLVEKLCGHEVALRCAKSLLLPMPRVHQSGYAVASFAQPHDDDRIRAVQGFLQQNYRLDLPTQALAEQAGLAPRTFTRRFKAATGRMPAAYLQALRIEAAKAQLERQAKSIQAISIDVGYDDVAFFRELFKRATGMTPGEYRSQFAPLAVRGQALLETPLRAPPLERVAEGPQSLARSW